jgi:type VI protein secretion system component Hcp
VAKYTLTDVVISSVTHSGATAKMPSEDISLRFGRIEIEYRSTDAKGGGSVHKAGWDVRANKAF